MTTDLELMELFLFEARGKRGLHAGLLTATEQRSSPAACWEVAFNEDSDAKEI